MSSASKIASGYYNYRGYQISKIPSGERNAGMWLITPPDSYDPSDIVFSLKEGKDLIDKFDAKGYYKGGFVDMNQYGLGQFSVPFSSLDGGESASTPDKAIKNALKSGDASDEYLVALAKADKAKSPAARKALLDIANEKNMADKFSYNMGMFG
jgi:hypothetical protein|tara:strand:+ start:56 stop:517 length:462 start_codon:yes stop_codon:yes gene_type:complete